jgi:ribonuclease P/MRP protein subunit POP1
METREPKAPVKGSEAKKRKQPPLADAGAKGHGRDGRSTGRVQKRAKFIEARSIQTQPSDAALKGGELDLQAFLNAREFEIAALEESMRKTKAASSTRAFQKVPRSMRRRTASHNAKRIPKRLRDRARKEALDDNTPTIEARKRRPRTTRARIRAETAKKLGILAEKQKRRKLKEAAEKQASSTTLDGPKEQTVVRTRPARPKIKRNELNEPQKPKAKFRKRQMDKTWLPTHLWHAKRARMTEPKHPLWRFAIPFTPNEKCYRPTHRAFGDKGAVIWDASYLSTIGLYGSEVGIERVLKALGATQENLGNKKGQRWRSGCRSWSGMLSKERGDQRRDIGPATMIWNTESRSDDTVMANSDSGGKAQRQMLIRCHPSCFLELFNELLKLVKMQKPQLYIEDLRFEIGSIMLAGPGSAEALLAVLKPYPSEAGSVDGHAKIFQSLAGVANAASLPADALLGFSVQDPRLHYPPKQAQPVQDGDAKLLETLTKWPVEEARVPFALFDRDARFRASRLPSQKSISYRRGINTPGEVLGVTDADPAIPVILLASRPQSSGQAQGTWTLLAPWKCIQAIWYSLVHYPLSTGGNPRFGGLDELRQVSFEQGQAWFPGDFPGTDAGVTWELQERQKRRAVWDRRPKGKRVEWKSLDLGAGRKGEVGDGLACDWERLFSLSRENVHATKPADKADVMEVDGQGDAEHVISAGSEAIRLVRQLSKTTVTQLVKSPASEKPHSCSIVTVRLTFVARGTVTSCARIYRLPSRNPAMVIPSTQAEVPSTEPRARDGTSALPDNLRRQWLSQLPPKSSTEHGSSPYHAGRARPLPKRIPAGSDMDTRKRLLAESLLGPEIPYPRAAPNQVDVDGHPLCPDEVDLMGFVTTGAFSLSDGKGTAIGSICADKAIDAMRTDDAKEAMLCVVRNSGEKIGWLARWELI